MRTKLWKPSSRAAMLLLPALAVFGACGGDSDDVDVEGVEWQLVELTGMPIPGAATPTLLLEDGMASGDAGCNRFSGEYSLDGEQIEIGPLAMTLMACQPDVDEFERAYLEALGTADTIDVADGEVVLSSSGADGILRYEQP